MLRGLVTCHGLNHRPLDLDPEIRWTYLDADERSNPDVITEIGKDDLTKILGTGRYSVIRNQGCPFYLNLDDFLTYLSAVKPLLTEDGYVRTSDVYEHWRDRVLMEDRYQTGERRQWVDIMRDPRHVNKFKDMGGVSFLSQSKIEFYEAMREITGFGRITVRRDGVWWRF